MKLQASLTFLCLSYILLVNGAQEIVKVRLESCPGCKLNRLSEVRAFVYEDFPHYENGEFKKIQGASPVLLFLNEADEVVEKHSLENLNRQECNNLLTERGFARRSDKEL